MFQYQSSVLFVKDIPASRRFYADLLGQKVSQDYGEYVGFEGGFGIWEADYVRRTVDLPAEESGQVLGRKNCELYFETERLDEALEKLSAAGVIFVHPVHEQPWGQRALRVYDPDGHIVEIGEPLLAVVRRLLAAGTSVDEIARRTSVARETVEGIAGEM